MVTIKFKNDEVKAGKFSLELLFDGLRQGGLLSCDDKDLEQFKSWISEYNSLLKTINNRNGLLRLGHKISSWLNKKENWMEKIIKLNKKPPLFIEFTVPQTPEPNELAFLETPWELLSIEKTIRIDKNQSPQKHMFFLAEDENYQYCPVRRIGNRKENPAPSEYRLSTVFMAASPHDVTPLNYEAEEVAIIEATGKKGIDLTVEESGCLALLSECIAEEEHVDILHISCHGTNNVEPVLLLETEKGQAQDVKPLDFSNEIDSNKGC